MYKTENYSYCLSVIEKMLCNDNLSEPAKVKKTPSDRLVASGSLVVARLNVFCDVRPGIGQYCIKGDYLNACRFSDLLFFQHYHII